jgi:hypothetical protein
MQYSLNNSTRQFQTVQERAKTMKKTGQKRRLCTVQGSFRQCKKIKKKQYFYKKVQHSARQYQTVPNSSKTEQEGSTQYPTVSDSARQFEKQYTKVQLGQDIVRECKTI